MSNSRGWQLVTMPHLTTVPGADVDPADAFTTSYLLAQGARDAAEWAVFLQMCGLMPYKPGRRTTKRLAS